MQRDQDSQQEQGFQVLLSQKDYQDLKQCKESFNQIKADYQRKIKDYESQKLINDKKLQQIVFNNSQLKKYQNQINTIVEQVYVSIKQKYDKMSLTYESQFPPSKKKPNTSNVIAHNAKSKLLTSKNLIDDSFVLFGLVLQKEHQKVANLIRQSIGLKQQISLIKEQNIVIQEAINEKCDQSKYIEKQRQNIQQKHKEQLRHNEKERLKYLHQIQKQKQQSNQFRQQLNILKEKLQISQSSFSQLKNEYELISQQNNQFEKQNRQLQDQIKQYQQHISILKQSIKLQSRNKEQNKQIKKAIQNHKSNSPASKFEKQDYIKETLIQYVREIRKNLISIGNLSQQEIKQIGTSQLRTLVKFIHQLQEDFQ